MDIRSITPPDIAAPQVVDLSSEMPEGAATRRFKLCRAHAPRITPATLEQFTPGKDYLVGVLPRDLYPRPQQPLSLYYHEFNGKPRYANYSFAGGVIEEVVLHKNKYYFRTKDACYILEFLDSGN
jgi:hypothetical protein